MAVITNTSTAREIIQASLDFLFDGDTALSGDDSLKQRMLAFENLTLSFVRESSASKPEGRPWDLMDEDVRFDEYALRAMVGRFDRDAFGVRQFQRVLSAELSDQKSRDKVWSAFKATSLRINTTNPRKTRIAASFSMWMATFRPVSLKPKKGLPSQLATEFCARLNLYIITAYLRQFGKVLLDAPFASARDEEHRLKLMERIFHDLTYRELRLSALEMLFCGIFHPRDEAH